MKLFNTINRLRRSIRITRGTKYILGATLFVAVAASGTVAISSNMNGTADAAVSACGNDSPNSIIRNGASSRSAFIAKVQASPELQNLYASRGLTSADYARFISSAQPGVALNNATIVVGNNVVATNVGSLGRLKGCQGTGTVQSFPVAGAGTYYGNLDEPGKAFASTTKSIPVDVLFNTKGEVQFAVMTGDCANPTYQTPVTPTYACNDLNVSQTGANSFNFNTAANAGNGATISKLVYNFGDGSAEQTTTNPATVVSHTFTKDSTVTVSVYISLPGGGTVVLTNCQHPIKFTPPTPPAAVFACNSLTPVFGKVDATGNQMVTLNAKASATNATIKSYTIDFGDKATPAVVATAATSASATHTYAPGNYTATVVVTVLTNTGETKTTTVTANCSTPINVKPLPSTLTCTNLTLTPGAIDSTGNQLYTLNAAATASNATITNYVFTFGDKTQDQTVTTSAATASSAAHTYAPGNWQASVVVNGKGADGSTITATSADCAKTVPVSTPQCKPGVPAGSKECYTYTCDLLTVTKGDNRTVTISAFKASSTNPNASVSSVNVAWGDSSTDLNNANVVGQQHTYGADGSYTITATAHFTITGDSGDTTASGTNCVQTGSYTTPPVTPPVTPPTTPPAQLVNTGAGDVIGIFAAAAIVAAFGRHLFIGRRLNREV